MRHTCNAEKWLSTRTGTTVAVIRDCGVAIALSNRSLRLCSWNATEGRLFSGCTLGGAGELSSLCDDEREQVVKAEQAVRSSGPRSVEGVEQIELQVVGGCSGAFPEMYKP